MTDDKILLAIKLLSDMAENLGRNPKRTDFDSETACFIKQKLGPWPRALEKAGLKRTPEISAKEKSKQKRERIRKKYKNFNKEV